MDQVAEPIVPEHAVSLWQPYAWLMAHGHKPIENRKKRFTFRGPIWIQATELASMDVWNKVRELCDEFLGKDFRLPGFDELALGAIIGRVTITGSIPPRSTPLLRSLSLPPAGKAVPWHFANCYGLICEDAVPLATPVKCRGRQSFPFRVPESVRAELRKAAV